MREIKFKGWYDDGKSQHMFSVGDEFGTKNGLDCCRYKADGQPVTLLQYTGRKDAEGVEIYEGDRLTDDSHYLDWVVSFIDGSFVAHDPDDESEFVMLDDYPFRVNGNIYENPELLK